MTDELTCGYDSLRVDTADRLLSGEFVVFAHEEVEDNAGFGTHVQELGVEAFEELEAEGGAQAGVSD